MDGITKLKQTILLVGDITIFYLSLLITLFIRYTIRYDIGFEKFLLLHFWPFTLILIIWILVSYITDLYDLRFLKNDSDFIKTFLAVIGINAALAITLFYLLPLTIAPRTNLFIFLIIFGLTLYIWRSIFNNFTNASRPANRVLLVGYNQTTEELVNYINKNPQLGYEIKSWMKEGLLDKSFEQLAQIILNDGINLIVIPAHIKKNNKAARLIYQSIALGVEVINLAEIYERVFFKIPLAELQEVWFLENLAKAHKIYEFFKRPIEIIITTVLLIFFVPFSILIAFLIAVTSKGPIILRQSRIGKRDKEFIIYKFRTMIANAEKNGPQWALVKDKRSTPLGALLRRSHLDEIPQFINVLKGNLSLIGPRPERPEFVKQLKKEILFYELRHLVKPGITGWAQINYRYGASIEDTYEKLQYDIYYLKNRSLILDFLILIRTLKLFFINLK